MDVLAEVKEIKKLMNKSNWSPAFIRLIRLEAALEGRGTQIEATRKVPVPAKGGEDERDVDQSDH